MEKSNDVQKSGLIGWERLTCESYFRPEQLKSMTMKRISTLICFLAVAAVSAFATDHTITTSGFSYSPVVLTVMVGDNVTIVASPNHPTTQVSLETWEASGTTPLAGGFGTNTTSFTFAITSVETIYYVCDNHVAGGMKGQIIVDTSSLDDYTSSVKVDLGAMPITDGILNYTIAPTTIDLGLIEVISINGKRLVSEAIVDNSGSVALKAAAGQYILLMRDNAGQVIYREAISVR